MKPMKKNKFFTFIFSLLPGAAEMYMGFMKNGLSLMALFFAACGIMVTELRFDFIMAVIALLWFWGFFHARNIASLDQESFDNYPDRYIWEEYLAPGTVNVKSRTLRTWAAVIIIIVGLSAAWDYITEIIYKFIPDGYYWDLFYPIINKLPGFVLAVALIIAGIMLIRGKKEELTEEVSNGETGKNA